MPSGVPDDPYNPMVTFPQPLPSPTPPNQHILTAADVGALIEKSIG
jgi:hypothetical protein